jgi:transposase
LAEEGKMPKFKHTAVENGQGEFVVINYKEQLLPGTLEYMLEDLVGKEIDTSKFQEKYKNDKTGASAIHPDALIKLILYGYSKGRKSSRGIWELSLHNIIAKALTKDVPMHWTSIADFVSGNSAGIAKVFSEVMMYCNELGLIGGETFAIDGLRLPSNASLEMSGRKAELEKDLEVYKKMAAKHLERHKRKDEAGKSDEETERKYKLRQKRLAQRIEKISAFLSGMEKKMGVKGKESHSNVTDNESALIRSGGDYIQGYIGIGVADGKNQIIVAAKAAGSSNEGEHFSEMLDKVKENMEECGCEAKEHPVMLADSNYWGENNLKAAEEKGFEAVIPDNRYRSRLGDKSKKMFLLQDFKYHEEGNWYECPCGKRLDFKKVSSLYGRPIQLYAAKATDCRGCPMISRCMRGKKTVEKMKAGRRLSITTSGQPGSLCNKAIEKNSTEKYQAIYAQRIGIIEPIYADIAYCKGLNRITVRGREKANNQWLLYCVVHNLGRLLIAYNARKGFI